MKDLFWQAVRALAITDATIQKRLAFAAQHLSYVETKKLPEELRPKFIAVMQELTKQKAVGEEGTIEATTRALTAEQAEKLAERIFDIYTEILGGI